MELARVKWQPVELRLLSAVSNMKLWREFYTRTPPHHGA